MFRSVVPALILFVCCPLLHGENVRKGENLLKPATERDAWRIEQLEGGRGEVLPEKDAVQFTVLTVDRDPYHVQAFQGNLDLEDGSRYTVSGLIKATSSRKIILTATIDEDDWHGIGLHEELNVSETYQPFEYTFQVSDSVRRKNRLGFVIGNETGSVWVQDLTLVTR